MIEDKLVVCIAVTWGHAVAQLVGVTIWKLAGSIPDWIMGLFH
jgi:hypothetical protein